MTILQIEYSEDTDNLVAVAELVDSELEVQQASVARNSPARFDVKQGEFQLRLRWSDGRSSKQGLSVGADDLVVPIDPPDTDPPDILSLGDPISIGETTPRLVDTVDQAVLRLSADPERRYRRRLRGINFSLDSLQTYGALKGLVTRDDMPRYTVWRKTGDAWEDLGLETTPRDIPGGTEFEVYLDSGLHVFEVSDRGASQYVSIPAEHAIIALRWVRTGELRHLRVDARTTDPAIESLRGYIARGNVEVARGLALNALAEQSLRSKVAAPRIAALGAYFLLRVGDLERLHNWPDNLSNWQPWLPDGPVISAWQRLRSPAPDLDEVLRLLLEAESRGMPIYTEGVRLLKDGLELFAQDPEADWDVDEPRRRVEAYAMAMDWTKSETTYTGDAPDKPRPLTDGAASWTVDGLYTGHPDPEAAKTGIARTPIAFDRSGWAPRHWDLPDRLSAKLLIESPFFGREFLRHSVADMLRTDGPEVLVVNGPRGSGKTFTLQFIEQLARQRQDFRVAAVDAYSVNHEAFGAEQLVRSFASQMGIPWPEVPTTGRMTSSPGDLAAWLLRQAESSSSNWWWVLDDFSSARPPEDVRILTSELAQMLGAYRTGNRLVLLDFDEPIPHDVKYTALREHLPYPSEIDHREVQGFLVDVLQQNGMTTLEADVDDATSELLKRVPQGDDRLAQLNLLLSEVTSILTKANRM